MNSFLVAKYWLNTSSVHCFYFWIESSYPHNKSKIRNTLNIWCCFPVSRTIFFQFIFIRMYTTDDLFFIFLSGFSFTDTDDSQDSRERDETIFYYTIPLTPTHKHSDIYLHFCMWDDYHVFNRIACNYQAATWWYLPLYRITIWLIDDVTLSFCLFTWWFDSSYFCYSNFRQEAGGFELTSTITLVLQANQVC